MTWWWVGFTDRTRPRGKQALGAIVVHHDGPEIDVEAFISSIGQHPGGEALFGRIEEKWGPPPPGFERRLLGFKEAEILSLRWDPNARGLAAPEDIRKAFLDDEAKLGDPLFPVTFSIQRSICELCGHQHAGPEVGAICIGCPCDERPGKDPP